MASSVCKKNERQEHKQSDWEDLKEQHNDIQGGAHGQLIQTVSLVNLERTQRKFNVILLAMAFFLSVLSWTPRLKADRMPRNRSNGLAVTLLTSKRLLNSWNRDLKTEPFKAYNELKSAPRVMI